MNPDFGKLLEGQVGSALLVLLCLPAGLLLLAARRTWLDEAAAAVEGRRTAAVLWGAGLFLALLLALMVCGSVRLLRWMVPILLAGAVAVFAAGFAAGAWAQGRSMLRREGGASCLVWGWIARAGAFAVPVLGLVLGAYFVALSLGTPVVALLRGGPKSTTDPSAGSTPPR